MRRLIVNADDFGLHRSVNAAVAEGHARGCITSASLMPTGAAFEEAAEAARKTPSLGVGVHLTLVAETPLSSASAVRTLVGADGRFAADHTVFVRRYLAGELDLGEVYREIAAQVERVVQAGVRLTHIDSHQHLHVLPKLMDMCVSLAKAHGIRAVRIPAEPYFFTGGYEADLKRTVGKWGLTFLANRARVKAKRAGLLCPAHFRGMLAGGHMRAAYLEGIVRALPEGVTEIMLHPGADGAALAARYGWGYEWEAELAAAISPNVLSALQAGQVELISFGELADA